VWVVFVVGDVVVVDGGGVAVNGVADHRCFFCHCCFFLNGDQRSWTMNSEASENVRQLQQDIGMQGLGEHMLTSSDLKLMCSVYVPAQIRLYSTEHVVEETEDTAQEIEQDSDQQELEKNVEKNGLHLHNTSDGCRIVMQSNVGSDNALDWKLLHVDFGQLGEDDHRDSMVTTRVEGSVLRF
jgi:hypothetical protein